RADRASVAAPAEARHRAPLEARGREHVLLEAALEAPQRALVVVGELDRAAGERPVAAERTLAVERRAQQLVGVLIELGAQRHVVGAADEPAADHDLLALHAQ